MPDRVLACALLVPFVMAALSAPVDRSEVLFSFTDPEIVESSGLAVVDGLVVTTNDSGDSGRVFTVDPRSGDTVGTTQWASEATDVEALAPAGAGAVWVADIGDNTGSRDSVTVTRVPVGRGDLTSDGPTYELAYPDGSHDAESLLADPSTGELYVVTKEVFGGSFYSVPTELSEDGPNRLERLGRVGDALSLATDAAFFPDGRHVVVRGYTVARIYAFPSLLEVATVDLPGQRQGEGIAVDSGGRLLLSSEGLHSDVLRLRLPNDVRDLLSPPASSTPSPTATSEPGGQAPGQDSPATAGTTTRNGRAAWPWLVSGLVGMGVVVVLVRSLRPR